MAKALKRGARKSAKKLSAGSKKQKAKVKKSATKKVKQSKKTPARKAAKVKKTPVKKLKRNKKSTAKKVVKAKKPVAKKVVRRKKPTARAADKKLITISARGLVDAVKTRDGIEFKIYSEYNDAVEGGIDKMLAAAVFRAGNCPGVCTTRKQFDRNGKLVKVWCVDNTCSRTGGCRCHLIKFTKNADGSWDEEDLGEHEKEDPVFPNPGEVHTCQCR